MHTFSDDPDIGKLVITTERLSHGQYMAMNGRIDVATGLRRNIQSIDKMVELSWPERPCRITVATPRIVRLLHRALRSGRDTSVKISSFDYSPPACSDEELRARVTNFLHLPSLPSFLRVVRDEVDDMQTEDAHKIAEKLFTAGLDDCYIIELL